MDVPTRRWRALAGLLLLAMASGCDEHAGLPRLQPEVAFLSQVTVRDFRQLTVLSPSAANGIYFGPSTFDPVRDIQGPITLSAPPVRDATDAVYVTVADGSGHTADGRACSVTVNRSRPDGPQLGYWELTEEQGRQVRAGTHVVVDIGVSCD